MHIQRDVELRPHNSLALAARAAYFARVENVVEARAALDFARDQRLRVTVLGGGSNVVLAGDLPGLTVQVGIRGRRLVAEHGGAIHLQVGAGEDWHQTVEYCLARGWYGLENLALIPGTVGAAPIQNIGAYGVELESRFVALEAIAIATGETRRFSRADCGFGYRDSLFKGAGRDAWLITAVTLALSSRPAPVLTYPALREVLGSVPAAEITPERIAVAVVALRRARLPDPARVPNAGSFFKNPVVDAEQARRLVARFPDLVTFPAADGGVKLAAAWLIERAGWKGVERAGVGVHDQQALVLVNRGGGAAALLALARDIRADVVDRFGVELEPEPRVLGVDWLGHDDRAAAV
ncbi:MAG: UDP-N-acetylmuramate dehydrogenase [Porticoccaceae bacterium]